MKFRVAIAMATAMLLSACGINSVPRAEEDAKAKWADVQASYQRRADLIPNLVATVRAAAGSESKILTEVTQARSRATSVQLAPGDLTDPAKVQAYQTAQQTLGGSLSRLLATVEAYPELKSQDSSKMLIRELAGAENRINVRIEAYNRSVQEYNTRIRTFPDAIGARVFYGAKPLVQFQAKPGADTPPDVRTELDN
ncbi:LemA family protein [Sphingomonas sp. HF-S3]|uniref:LemA family protein n=1 Tax=Sphingomonas rustica TaxID=3103142 RepID=A0ABV0B7Z5_9SPHN